MYNLITYCDNVRYYLLYADIEGNTEVSRDAWTSLIGTYDEMDCFRKEYHLGGFILHPAGE